MKNYEFALTGSSGQLLAYGQTQDIGDKGLQQVVQALCTSHANTVEALGHKPEFPFARHLPGGRMLYVAEADVTCQTGR